MKIATNIRLPDEVDLDLRVRAAQNRQSISVLATEAIKYYLDHYQQIKKKKA